MTRNRIASGAAWAAVGSAAVLLSVAVGVLYAIHVKLIRQYVRRTHRGLVFVRRGTRSTVLPAAGRVPLFTIDFPQLATRDPLMGIINVTLDATLQLSRRLSSGEVALLFDGSVERRAAVSELGGGRARLRWSGVVVLDDASVRRTPHTVDVADGAVEAVELGQGSECVLQVVRE